MSSPDAADTSSLRLALTALVPNEFGGERLDRTAAALFDEYSRTELTRWIRAGELRVNGGVAAAKKRLLGGERLDLTGRVRELPAWQTPQPVEFGVLHEDEDLIVVAKPVGLVVHPGAGQPAGTLVNGLLHRFPQLKHLPRAGIVHRLDKDTSGALAVAASPAAHRTLVQALAERRVERRYRAIAIGRIDADRRIEAPIGRDPSRRTRQAVVAHGKPAVTHVRVLERFAAHSLIEARLETGRTHQIRVHLAHVGHPLVGDARYGARLRLPAACDAALESALRAFEHQALHAWRLGLTHPRTGQWLEFEAAEPDDFRALVNALRHHADPDTRSGAGQ
ncbi:MAG: 23S rRNA pseudouridine(1911/1915/1917) synthase RluD [Pseudomonadota bacterium]